MARGGPRPKAGRPKGSKNKVTKALDEAIGDTKALIGDGLTPLAYLLEIMRDPAGHPLARLEAAKAALPYCHRRQPQDVKIDAVIYTPPPVVLVHTAPEEAAGDDGGSPLN
jgi:hypothetical protein